MSSTRTASTRSASPQAKSPSSRVCCILPATTTSWPRSWVTRSAHALAHHASERLALNPDDVAAFRESGGRLANLDLARRQSLIGLLDAGAALESLSYGRFQEAEADHIGVFLMTFAGYDPRAALEFWGRMREASSWLAPAPGNPLGPSHGRASARPATGLGSPRRGG